MESFFMKKVPSYFVGRRGDIMLYLHIFPNFLRFIPDFCGTNYNLLNKNYLATVFKVIQYGFEIFLTFLSLNC